MGDVVYLESVREEHSCKKCKFREYAEQSQSIILSLPMFSNRKWYQKSIPKKLIYGSVLISSLAETAHLLRHVFPIVRKLF